MSIFAGLRRTVAPTSEVLSLDTVEAFLRVESDVGGPVDQDIEAFISFAREQCETSLRRTLLRSTWQLSLKNWPGRSYQNWPQSSPADWGEYFQSDHIKLPMAAPLDSVASVVYRDTSAASFTMPQGNVAGGYNVDANFEPGRIVLPFSQIWPTTILLPGAPIQITYLSGYADINALKAGFEGYHSVVQAMKLIITDQFENKVPIPELRKSYSASALQYVIEELLTPFRIFI